MRLIQFLDRLDGVKRRGSSFMARCPAHADRGPSLSLRQGENARILVHCFAGCRPEEIVAALGLTLADLFEDAPLNERRTPKPNRIDRVALAFRFDLAALDRRLRAERIITAGQKLHADTMTNDELDRALGFVARAHTDGARAELFGAVADTLRERDYIERTSHGQQRRSA